MKSGILTISLDFELLWGIFDKVGMGFRPSYFSNTREIVPRMLERFAEAGVQVTWATVGMLFAENEEEWKSYSPNYTPTYRQKELSAYEWVKIHGIYPQVHFAPVLIKMVVDTPGQELGSHTYAHYYTLMRGQSPEQFREDLRACQRIAGDKFGVELQSLVFPRNHINELYMKVCLEEGFQYVRGNPKNWFWQETQYENLLKRVLRTADCFFPVGQKTTFNLDEIKAYPEEPLVLPASRILRPFNKSTRLMNWQRLNRIKAEMEEAAQRGEVYHLWWHPHNFGNDPQGSLRELDQVISHFQNLNQEYGMQSLNMKGLGELLHQELVVH